MKILSFFLILTFSVIFTAWAKEDERFRSLLNGKDLSGWKTDGNWVVQKDGSLMIDPCLVKKDGIVSMIIFLPRKNTGILFSKWNINTQPKETVVYSFGWVTKESDTHRYGGTDP